MSIHFCAPDKKIVVMTRDSETRLRKAFRDVASVECTGFSCTDACPFYVDYVEDDSCLKSLMENAIYRLDHEFIITRTRDMKSLGKETEIETTIAFPVKQRRKYS